MPYKTYKTYKTSKSLFQKKLLCPQASSNVHLGLTRDINKRHLWRDTINLSMQRFALNAESVTKYSNQKTPSGGTKKFIKSVLIKRWDWCLRQFTRNREIIFRIELIP